jgi:hypothetical protein
MSFIQISPREVDLLFLFRKVWKNADRQNHQASFKAGFGMFPDFGAGG